MSELFTNIYHYFRPNILRKCAQILIYLINIQNPSLNQLF